MTTSHPLPTCPTGPDHPSRSFGPRGFDGTTTADLGNLILSPGVHAGPSKGALGLTGPLVLDGGGDPTAVLILQTDSALTTASSSTVSLINGAQECNVFWQVGSSTTLGTDSVFVGNIMALASITVTTNVTVHGRALARSGAVTLDTDTFVAPTCDTTPGGGRGGGGGGGAIPGTGISSPATPVPGTPELSG
ncbi:MAG: ice-binding family protein [Acidimicrobiales bacterium]